MRTLKTIFQILSRYGWTATLIILGAFAVGFTWSSSDELYTNIRLFDRAALAITSDYVEILDERALIKAGIDGMLSRLDPYSRYLSDADYLYLRQETEGEFEGIGVALGIHHDTLTVESVLDGTPGFERGIIAGDRIVAIDSKSTMGLDIRAVKMMLRGPAGGVLTLEVARPGVGILELKVERAKVEIKSIPFFGMASADVGYVRLARFSDGCSAELHRAIRDLKKQGMRSLILDLRGNPGGLLVESVEIASMFLPEKSAIVETRGRGGQVGESYLSGGKSDFQKGGLAILVDSLTASAAEIVAGAIQDHDRGIIIGSDTFGKGLVQQVMQFTENSALKLTTAKYYLPSGRCLQKGDWSTFELVASERSKQTDSVYRTDSGREVLGNGGIIPDIYVNGDFRSAYIDTLRKQSLFFDFALDYLKESNVSPDIKVDSTLMDQFRQFLRNSNFRYQTEERAALIELKKNIKKPSEKINSALNVIDRELTVSETRLFDSSYPGIANTLRETLVRQEFGEITLYQKVWLPTHPEISEAVKILSDTSRYSGILAAR